MFLKVSVCVWYRPFGWITDCSGIIKFETMELMPYHQLQRWKLDLSRYCFWAMHRPEHMLCECNALSRYNMYADQLRADCAEQVKEKDAHIEAKLKGGANPNKGVKHLAAVTRAASFVTLPRAQQASVFSTMVLDFDKSLLSYDNSIRRRSARRDHPPSQKIRCAAPGQSEHRP